MLLMQKGVGFNAAAKTVRITIKWGIFTFSAYMLGKLILILGEYAYLKLSQTVVQSLHSSAGCCVCGTDHMGTDTFFVLYLFVGCSSPPALSPPSSNSICPVLVPIPCSELYLDYSAVHSRYYWFLELLLRHLLSFSIRHFAALDHVLHTVAR